MREVQAWNDPSIKESRGARMAGSILNNTTVFCKAAIAPRGPKPNYRFLNMTASGNLQQGSVHASSSRHPDRGAFKPNRSWNDRFGRTQTDPSAHIPFPVMQDSGKTAYDLNSVLWETMVSSR